MDTNSFPHLKYDQIKVLSLDSSIYRISEIKLFDDGWLDQNDGFLDKQGNPIHKKITSYTLNKQQRQEVAYIFRPTCPGDDSLAKKCVPMYRDAVIFYENEKPVAFVNVCFQCEQASSFPASQAMNCFANEKLPDLKVFFKKYGFYQKNFTDDMR
ncbi:MAG: hypothetical protein H7Y04_00560 [Verrucomicrobia bacterium]|nr:hypothetical protein [Cytophagales bacterium]